MSDAEQPETDDALIGRVIAERYEILRRLGAGGMGAVYLAKQLAMDREVALKLLHQHYSMNKQAVARFHREMQVTARIEHANTIRVYDFGETEDKQLFLAMEFLQGKTLSDAMKKGEPMASERLVDIAVQIGKALMAAHSEGVVHRDLKPDNVMLLDRYGETDFVKVLDFGIARFMDDQSRTQLTAEGAVVGTPAYMSPEQATGGVMDHRTDIYSFGVMLFEMATGQVPFDAPTTISLMVKHVQEMPPRPSELAPGLVPPVLETLILRMLAKSHEERPQSVAEVVQTLENALAPAPQLLAADTRVGAALGPTGVAPVVTAGAAPTRSEAATTAPKGGSKKGLIAGLVGVLVAAGVAAAIAMSGGSSGPVTSDTRVASAGDASGSADTRGPVVAAADAGRDRPGEADTIATAGGDTQALVAAVDAGATTPGVDTAASGDTLAAVAADTEEGADTAAALDTTIADTAPVEVVDPAIVAARETLNTALAALGEPPGPRPCQVDDLEVLRSMIRAAALLKGGRVNGKRSEDKQAVTVLSDASGRGGGSAEYWSLVSRARAYAGKTAAVSLEAATRAVGLCERYAPAHNAVGNAHLRLNNRPEAEAAYAKAVDIAPSYGPPRFNLGILRLADKRLDDAIAAFTVLLDRHPEYPNAHMLRGQAYLQSKQLKKAAADFKSAAGTTPDDPRPWLLLGQLELSRKQPGHARVAFCKAKELGSAEAAAHCPDPPTE